MKVASFSRSIRTAMAFHYILRLSGSRAPTQLMLSPLNPGHQITGSATKHPPHSSTRSTSRHPKCYEQPDCSSCSIASHAVKDDPTSKDQ
ncbi:hypothetical protein RYX36_032985 [Vicia faba]